MSFKNLNINVVFVVIVLIISSFFIRTNNSINVSGECMKKVAKDRVSIILEVKNLDKNSSVATQKSNKTYKTISDYVVELQHQYPEIELETTTYNTYEKREWDAHLKKNVSLGIESVIGLEITSPKMELVGTILAEVAKLNDVYPNGLRTFVSKETLKKSQAECLAEAVKNAHDKAMEMARANGQKIGKMTSANMSHNFLNSNTRINYSMARKYAGGMVEEAVMDDDAGPSIFTGNADVSVNVNATFELK